MEVVPRSGSSKTDANAGAPNGAARALSKQRGSTCSHVTCLKASSSCMKSNLRPVHHDQLGNLNAASGAALQAGFQSACPALLLVLITMHGSPRVWWMSLLEAKSLVLGPPVIQMTGRLSAKAPAWHGRRNSTPHGLEPAPLMSAQPGWLCQPQRPSTCDCVDD